MRRLYGQEIKVEEVQDTTETRYGAYTDAGGWINFVVFSPDADQVSLLLYNTPNATKAEQVVPMKKHGNDWRVRFRGIGIGVGLLYMYEAEGAYHCQGEDRYYMLASTDIHIE
jgi:pullulanase/glycogen debranching enzyme